MIKIAHKREEEVLRHLPKKVVKDVVEILTVLDDNYSNIRDVDNDLGGYVLIAEIEEDVEDIQKLIEFGYTLPEFVDLITCENGERHANSLIILSSDYN